MGWPTEKEGNGFADKINASLPGNFTIRLLEKDPSPYYVHFTNGKNAKCTGDGCAICSAGIEKKSKYFIKVFDTESKTEKVLSGTEVFFVKLNKIIVACGGADKFNFKCIVDKKGQKIDYTIIPLVNENKVLETKNDEEVPF